MINKVVFQFYMTRYVYNDENVLTSLRNVHIFVKCTLPINNNVITNNNYNNNYDVISLQFPWILHCTILHKYSKHYKAQRFEYFLCFRKNLLASDFLLSKFRRCCVIFMKRCQHVRVTCSCCKLIAQTPCPNHERHSPAPRVRPLIGAYYLYNAA